MPLLIAFSAGLLFSIGIALSGMIDPARVLGFLKVSDNWDPSLALVMAGALAVYVPGFRFTQRKNAPHFAEKFYLPGHHKIDRSLLIGATLFGSGWGLAGYCPGPAIAALTTASTGTLAFVAAMVAGWFIARKIKL